MIPKDVSPQVNQIFESQESDIVKLTAAYQLITEHQIYHSKNECDLYRATGDREAMIREQIKHSTMAHMFAVFAECYHRATGSPLLKEQQSE